MTDIVIKQGIEEKKEPDESDIKETLRQADEYTKLKEQNDRLEAEYLRQQELRAKLSMGGRAEAGNTPKERTQDDEDQETADKILKQFQ